MSAVKADDTVGIVPATVVVELELDEEELETDPALLAV